MAGRPSKLTPELQAEICGYIAGGLTYHDACYKAGVGESTFHRWKSQGETAREGKYKEFWESVQKADADFKDARTREIIFAAQEAKNWQAAAWLLERRFPAEYGRRIEHAGEIKNVGPPPVYQLVPADAKPEEPDGE